MKFLRCLSVSGLIWVAGFFASVLPLGAARVGAGEIKAVTVYPTGALVKREVALDLAAGINQFELTGLPESLLDETLQVSGSGPVEVKILDVRLADEHQVEPHRERLRELQNQLHALEDQRTQLRQEVTVLNGSKAYLEGIREFYTSAPESGTPEMVAAETWRERIAFNETESARILAAELRAQQRLRELEPEITAVNRAIGNLQPGEETLTRVVTLQLESPVASGFNLELNYMVEDAAWSPNYLVRVAQETEELELAVKAVVEQTTGEDWNAVALTLSTARPRLENDVPSMRPWRLRQITDPRDPRVVTSQFLQGIAAGDNQALLQYTTGTEVGAIQGNFAGLEDGGDGASEAQRLARVLESRASSDLLAATFELPFSVSLPSARSPQTVTVATISTPCTIYHWALPKVTGDVYLKARALNPVGFPLLPGRTQVFLDGRFVAGSIIEYLAPGEEMNFLLGTSPRLQVERKLVTDLTERVGFGNKTARRTFGYDFEIENHDDQGTLLILRDQLPLSSHEEIAVKLLEPAAARVEIDEIGSVLWRLDLASHEKRTVQFRFQIDYPFEWVVGGL